MIMGLKSMHYNKKDKTLRQGISLIEVIIYIAILAGISIFIVNFLINVVNSYQRVKAEREVISNARLILETLQKSVSQAGEVYTPTSRFNNNAGQLALVTQVGAVSPHTTNYEDFWVDNGVARTRREGSAELTISSAAVRVTKLRFERIVQGLGREAIKMTLQVDSASAKFPASITLNSTISVRNY
jgi:type II secretory pathway component PulJ